MYKISIILPVFNVEKFLENALQSIINQTMDLNDIEVIMVDDASTDGSRKIMEQYSSKYSNFISLFHEKNSGGGGFPRNTGLKVASGEYVMFLDPDDEYLSENCEKLYETIKKYDVDVAFGRFQISLFNSNKYELSYSPFSNFAKNNEPIDIIYAKNLQDNFDLLKIAASVWTKIYKREFLVENNFQFHQFISEDIIFVLKTFKKANGIIFLNNFVGYIYYRYNIIDNESSTNNISFKHLCQFCDSLFVIESLIKDFPKEVRSSYIRHHLNYWFGLYKKSELTKDEIKYFIEIFKEFNNLVDVNFKTRMLLFFIIYYLKLKVY